MSNKITTEESIEKNRPRSFEDIIQILFRRKNIILYSVLAAIAGITIFNTFSEPVYESSVMLKKEKQKESSMQDIYQEMILMQTRDEIETEMELAGTREVLKNAVDELNLYMNIEALDIPGEDRLIINSSLPEYRNKFMAGINKEKKPSVKAVSLQRQNDADIHNYVKITGPDEMSLFETNTDRFIATGKIQDDKNAGKESPNKNKSISTEKDRPKTFLFKTPEFFLAIEWPNARPGSRLYFVLNNYNAVLGDLSKKISVNRVAKTDIFEIKVKAHSAYLAMIIANTLADKYREVRLKQQKMNIKSAFQFADNQIKEVQEKLMKADDELSKYKSEANITTLSDNSRELVDFLSNLEAEKVKTELDLTQHNNKLDQMEKEMQANGYFDQTYLTPDRNDRMDSPFSILQKQLADMELQRILLMEKKKSTHPDIVMIDNQIKTAREKLTKYNQNTLTAYKILINTDRKKYQNLQSMSNKYNQKIKRLPGQESRLAELKRNKDVFEKMFVALLDKREEMRMAELSKLQDMIVVESAVLSERPVFPKKILNYAAGLLFGIIAGLIAVIVLEFIRRRRINLDNIENNLPFPLMAIIPKYSKQISRKMDESEKIEDRLPVLMENADGIKESYRVLRTKIYHTLEGENKMILFTSFEENTGKTTVISNLAISMAMSGKKILLIDLDLRRATLSRNFRIPAELQGIIGYLEGRTDIPGIYTPANYDEEKKMPRTLDIFPAGGVCMSSSELLASEKMEELFNQASSSRYDYILIDTPPVTRVTDALIIGRRIKNAVLIIKPEFTFRDSIKWGLNEMEQINMNILGSVANASEIEKSSYRYGYGYGYGYQTDLAEKKDSLTGKIRTI